ncbi:uncharacterized protein LOC131234956 isoform X3 [Magnolia sinica]|uniref:uncharacterized protein LOC131234956 isoform X3 n=1 Tax=Magnolia sinica TaxID=86752 RepID=UPI0026591768|nr:uncharacterized protein LOC131234956 isoform X3 [Magnolia sinica]
MMLSDDDDIEFDRVTYDHGCLENLRSIYHRGKKKLEKSSSEDEVEMHNFQNEDEFLHSHPRNHTSGADDEAISDEENDDKVISSFSFNSGATKSHNLLHDSENEHQDASCTWSAVLKEAEELVSVHENDGSTSHATNSEARKFQKGSGGKAKHKFSIRLQPYREGLSWTSVVKDENAKSSEVSKMAAGLEALEYGVTEHSMAGLLEGLQEENEKLSEATQLPGELVALVQRGTDHSMVELLDGLQEKNGSSRMTPSMHGNMKERRFQHHEKRTLSSLGDRTLDNEDPLENMDHRMSSEDEDSNQNHLCLQTTNIKGQTMVDRFQEAFRPVAMDGEGGLFPISKQAGCSNLCRSGYYERLQQVMQKEKDRHMEFLKQLQTEASSNDESRCIDVQLLSRYLDAKLTVCNCTILENSKSFQCMKSPQILADGGSSTNRIIVFSPKICDNVELEVGNSIRIHPPWYELIRKEVQVAENEIIILCTYFSQISA